HGLADCPQRAAGPQPAQAAARPLALFPHHPPDAYTAPAKRRQAKGGTMTDWPEKSLEDWRKLAAGELKSAGPDSLIWDTPEGIKVKPLYTAEDLAGLETVGSLPGFAPFTRGPKATMYAGRPWTLRQYAGFSTAEESNAFYRANLA